MDGLELNNQKFIDLLSKMVKEGEHLQNNPPKWIPKEDKAGQYVLEELKPFSSENGGPLKVEHLAYHPGRGNIVITYPAQNTPSKTVAFVGSHLDVVPADPKGWERPPFQLTVEGDKLYGRGTTDCLGHVALLTDLFVQLAQLRPKLDVAVVGVFIASEENDSIPGVGVDQLLKDGKLESLKGGPVYWVDSADSQPCIGTASAIGWKLKVEGKLFHSGLPHQAINPLELGSEALAYIQKRFYSDFPPHANEGKWNFLSPSTMKPTRIETPEGSLNQIPPHCTISGDIRMTPFYDCKKVMDAVNKYVADINQDLSVLPTRGPVSKYELPAENRKGKVEVEWAGEPFRGIACDINSIGFAALRDATKEVLGEVKPYSIGGSLPLVCDLQEAGLDIQITGFGKSSVYHGDNEYCLLSDMQKAFKIVVKVITTINGAVGK